MMRWHVVVGILAVAFAMAVAACGSGTNETSGTADTTVDQAAPADIRPSSDADATAAEDLSPVDMPAPQDVSPQDSHKDSPEIAGDALDTMDDGGVESLPGSVSCGELSLA